MSSAVCITNLNIFPLSYAYQLFLSSAPDALRLRKAAMIPLILKNSQLVKNK
jgi:hypothetical protein